MKRLTTTEAELLKETNHAVHLRLTRLCYDACDLAVAARESLETSGLTEPQIEEFARATVDVSEYPNQIASLVWGDEGEYDVMKNIVKITKVCSASNKLLVYFSSL